MRSISTIEIVGASIGASRLNETVIPPDSPAQPKLKHQINKFCVDMNKNDTIIAKQYQCSKPLLVKFGITLFIGMTIDIVFGVEYIKSFLLPTIITFLAIIGLCCYLVKFNKYIFKQALKSFSLWYKFIHAVIATTGQQIYFGFWTSENIDFYHDVPPNVNNNNILYFIRGIMIITFFALLIITASATDGLATKSNFAKRFFLIISMLVCIIHWSVLYFNWFEDYVVNPQLTIKMFGQIHTLSWRSITLSSFFKTFVFITAQLFLNLRHPNKINVVVLPVEINRINYHMDNMDNMDSMDINKQVRQTSDHYEEDEETEKNNNQLQRHPMALRRISTFYLNCFLFNLIFLTDNM